MSLITATRSFTRPSTSIAWYVNTADFQKFWDTTYVDSGLLLFRDKIISKDGLTMTITHVWSDQDSYDARMDNDTVKEFFALRTAYNTANGITEDTPVITVMK